ncbi:flagellar filament capping protein FliD [Sporomusa termitida]|uniref:Flagellar hook-associated protein 2 n=1 Tax=Sporomusa termitida TaxID=2377 RepID=A0A517DX57_9FIRM|nr:flagellar filament capping protein FliD [Sporomusa termitida]QDR81941.1 hypothetical protein SPTER_33610 [Sporomusa termitida]
MVMRTYGLSGSGMDVDQLVKDLMKARRASYDKVWQQKTQVEWKKKDFNTIYSLTEEFRNKTVSDFRKQSNLSPKLVTSMNDAVVSATANGEAANVSHSVIVDRLADGVKLSSSAGITGEGKLKTSLQAQFGYDEGTSFNLMINGKEITVDTSKSLNDVVTQINNAGIDLKANYDATLDRFYLYTNKTGAAANVDFSGTSAEGMDFLFAKLKLGSTGSLVDTSGLVSRTAAFDADELAKPVTGPLSFTVKTQAGTKTISLDAATSINDFLSQLNAEAGAGTAAVDANGRIVIKAGSINDEFTLEGDDAASKSFLADTLGLVSLSERGQNASLTLDGVKLEQASNTFTISGVSYNLKSVSYADTAGNPIPTTIEVKSDIDKTIATVKSFIETYNTYLSALNNELSEDKYRDFAPLTDEQKADMKESEIKAWEEKAKSGMLRRDPILTDMVNKLRLSFIEPIAGLSGKYQSAADIGIGTGSYVDDEGNFNSESSLKGKLYVKEDDLRKALEEDPDIVFKIFGTSGDTIATEGVANRVYEQMYGSLQKLQTEAGKANTTDTTSNLAKRLTDYEERLTTMTSRLANIESRYYTQFDAMEAALSKLSQQSLWLSQQLGS